MAHTSGSDSYSGHSTRWQVPSAYRDYEWVSSPLTRARQTADLLALDIARVEPAIIEMDWGDWAGPR